MGLAKEYIERLAGRDAVALVAALRTAYHAHLANLNARLRGENTVRNYQELREILLDLVEHLSAATGWNVPPERLWADIENIARRRVGDVEEWVGIAVDHRRGGLDEVLSDVMHGFQEALLQEKQRLILSEFDPMDHETKIAIATELLQDWGHLIRRRNRQPAELALKCPELLIEVVRMLTAVDQRFGKH